MTEEFFETTVDKFTFKVPKDYLYNRDDCWLRLEGDKAVIGITDFKQQLGGDVAFVETKEAGSEVNQGDEFGQLETIKTTMALISPASGTVGEINPEIESRPEVINEDPYGAGWIISIKLKDIESDKKNLLDGASYFELMKEKIAEEEKKRGE